MTVDPRVRPRKRAFSLLELLTVIAIIAILATLTIPSISGLQRSFNLSKSASLLRDNLQFARQQAISRNVAVTASFCKQKDDFDGTSFNTLLLTVLNPDNSRTLVSKPIRLPDGFGIAEDAAWSPIMNLSQTNISAGSLTNVPCRQFRFRPNGATDLPSSTNWFWTVFNYRASASPAENFITLQIDPRTARIISYQP